MLSPYKYHTGFCLTALIRRLITARIITVQYNTVPRQIAKKTLWKDGDRTGVLHPFSVFIVRCITRRGRGCRHATTASSQSTTLAAGFLHTHTHTRAHTHTYIHTTHTHTHTHTYTHYTHTHISNAPCCRNRTDSLLTTTRDYSTN
jgi:hypothetical protein